LVQKSVATAILKYTGLIQLLCATNYTFSELNSSQIQAANVRFCLT